jgi:hypothetical protein
MPMPEAETSKTVQLIDRLLDFFADDRNWLRGDYHDGDGRRCLVDAVRHLASRRQIPYGPVLSVLDEALPERRGGLIRFNDLYCRSIAELRAVILKARALAIQNEEHERTAEALKRWLLAEIEQERAARAAAGDNRKTYVLCPRDPHETVIAQLGFADFPLAASAVEPGEPRDCLSAISAALETSLMENGEEPADSLAIESAAGPLPFRRHDLLAGQRARRQREEQRSLADRADCGHIIVCW